MENYAACKRLNPLLNCKINLELNVDDFVCWTLQRAKSSFIHYQVTLLFGSWKRLWVESNW